jgi:hypothetical protein
VADMTVSQQDITNLAKKLDELGDVLTEKERTLLLATFKLAGMALQSKLQGSTNGSATAASDTPQTESGQQVGVGAGGIGRATGAVTALPSLSKGFQGAYTALGSSSLNVAPDFNKAAGGVGIGIIW